MQRLQVRPPRLLYNIIVIIAIIIDISDLLGDFVTWIQHHYLLFVPDPLNSRTTSTQLLLRVLYMPNHSGSRWFF